ncbi:carbohydrate ABC transporter substrate-binding protein (CUT1 family) [Kribbella amoyensis]|uniref:Carbohydrate ABC transporter substrate-binding protein (CUT1 family) n=1 Tax=Kribbella amoyensis TaxID=996641 RepID=A0A561BVU1_9ACTN|nr:extracellular solute-binding protein [Kribbella amoyensis]TWD82971.1 carbohydrate ABC transporter substrate-binding protein (CUT1 family) [Kribbella amoyensis]
MRTLTQYRGILRAAAGAAAAALLLAACAPGGNSEAGPAPSEPVSIGVGSEPVTLKLLVTSGVDVPLYTALGKLFSAKYSNVTVKVENQDYATLTTTIARTLAGNNVPDLVRVPQLGNLTKDHLLISLDPYAKAYGWDKWPQSQFASTRVAADGRERGTGPLYAAGAGFGLTGVYYSKALAQRIGMTRPPATVAEFEQLLAKAKDAGLQPIMINGKDGGSVYPLQNLVMSYAGDAQAVQDWNYTKPGASIDTEATVKAATTLQRWGEAGYLPADVNDIDQTRAPAEFLKGNGVFFPSGNWQAPGLDKTGSGQFGFFLAPPDVAGGPSYAMTAAANLGIPARSPNADVAAAFLDFVQTDQSARQETVTLGGLVPAGPSDAPVPAAPEGSAVAATVSAFQELLKNNELVGFMADATASIHVNSLVPQTQLLLAGKTTPESFAAKVQSDYERDLGR